MVTGSSTTFTAVELHEEVDRGAQCVVIRDYICTVGPHLLLANVSGGSPPTPAERGERLDRPRRLPGRDWNMVKVVFTFQQDVQVENRLNDPY